MFPLLSCTLLLMFSTRCAWQAKMFYPNAFQTGKVLDKGETQSSIHLPMNLGIAHGFSKSGFELSGIGGFSGLNTGGIGFAVSKAITRGDLFFTSGTADAELFFNTGYNFAGMRFTGTYAIGYYPKDWFGIYVPLKVGYLFYDLDGAKGNGVSFIPGLGISFEGKKIIFRVGGNVPLPSSIDENVIQLPYLAVQISQRW